MVTDDEAEKLRNDPRVYCVEIPPEHRTDIEIRNNASQTGLCYGAYSVNPNLPLGINWGLFALNFRRNVTNSGSPERILTYDYPLDASGVDLVIQDTGCQVNHPEFTDAAGVTRVQQIDWFAASGISGTMPATFYTDNNGHGTHVAGIAAGKTYGRAKNARIYVMTVAGLATAPTVGISVSNVFDCIKGWQNNKPINPATGYKRPTVVNMSWGYTTTISNLNGGVYQGTPWTPGVDPPQYGLVTSGGRLGVQVGSVDVDVAELLAAGVVLVGAAGNYYQANDVPGGVNYNNYCNNNGSQTYYMRGGSPACSSGVICVGNIGVQQGSNPPDPLDRLFKKWPNSDSGPRVDVYAPGWGIISSMSNTNQFGATTLYPYNSAFLIAALIGTSMASPNIAGVAAQFLQVYPTATPTQIRQMIIDASTPDMLYDSGNPYDYLNVESLHGSPNRFGYQPFNIASTGNVAGSLTMTNTVIAN
jgi:subtilisin family serine protease